MNVSMRVARCLVAALLLGGIDSAGWAQGTRGTIRGVAVAPSGAPQANLTLIVTNAAGIDQRAVSDMNGEFVFGGLQPGPYRLRTEDDTFAPFSQDQIALVAGQTVTVRIALQPRVQVGAAPNARATVQGTVIGADGRPLGATTLILTTPAGIDRREVSEASGNYVFGGLPPGAYRLRIDEPGPGGLPFALANLALAPGEQRQLDIHLQPVPAPPPGPGAAAGGGGVAPAPGPKPGPNAAAKPTPEPIPRVTAENGEFEAVPDRWRFKFPPYERYSPSEKMPWLIGSSLDPYNQNPAKADFPIGNSSLFANLNLQLNSAINPREVGAGAATSQVFFNNNFVAGLEVFRGDTVFVPKSWAVRGTIVGNVNALSVASTTNTGQTFGVEEAFAEKRLAVLDPAFDFISVRGGVQNFNSDFRGYLFVDNQLGVRLFGNARSNRDQYNVAYFSMRDRDPVSQLHRFTSRNQDVVIANYYIQDLGAEGYTGMFNIHINHDGGTPADPHTLQVVYVGFHGDGKLGPFAVSHAFYQAFGSDDDNRIARQLSGNPKAAAPVSISAQMAAFELSKDADWRRYRLSVFYASGDSRSDPGKAGGFDAITDNPNLAGGQFMFWTQQNTKTGDPKTPQLISEKFSLLSSLRSKFTDRSNFVNPGLVLLNGGVDLRVSPQLKVVTNASFLRFADATVLQQLAARQKRPGFEDNAIGWDIGAGAKFRPFVNENLFIVLGFSTLVPQGGFKTALGSDGRLYSVVGALQMAF